MPAKTGLKKAVQTTKKTSVRLFILTPSCFSEKNVRNISAKNLEIQDNAVTGGKNGRNVRPVGPRVNPWAP